MGTRENFEGLPHIKEKLNGLVLNVRDWLYEAKNPSNADKVADMHWVNGAWYAFQEQQKRIDALEKELEMRKQGASVMSWHRDQIIEIVNSYHSGSDTDDMRDEILELLK